ncbi:MAG: hypothetical protein WB555_23360 [Candidatus Korobacteraceae bacterium]
MASCLGQIASGQTGTTARPTSPPPHTAVPAKRYCHPNDGFCFRYPGTWLMLGEVFAGNGVVVAPQQKEDRALWDAITVALVVPPPEGDEEGPGLNGIVEQSSTAMREAGQNFVTLQRQERTIDHKPAQLLKVQYKEKTSGRDWIEELVFIEGPDNEIYSVALKCAPQNVAKLEPAFAEVLRSWTLPEAEPVESDDEKTPPAQSAPPAQSPPH